jgi:hypothetical protein
MYVHVCCVGWYTLENVFSMCCMLCRLVLAVCRHIQNAECISVCVYPGCMYVVKAGTF